MLRRLPRPAARTDEALFAGLLRAEESVFDELYREAYPKTHAALLKRACPAAEAEDLFQDALVALWQNARDGKYRPRPGTRMSTYLTQLCINRWIDRTRRVDVRRTEIHASPVETATPATHAAELAEMEARELRELRHDRLDAAVAKLPDACRTLLRRFYFERASLAEIAEERGISTASAKTEKYRCMQRLRRLCAERFPEVKAPTPPNPKTGV